MFYKMGNGFDTLITWETIKVGESVNDLDDGGYYSHKLENLEKNSKYKYKAYALVNGEYVFGDEITVENTFSGYEPPLIKITNISSTGATGNITTYPYNRNSDWSVDDFGILYKIGDYHGMVISNEQEEEENGIFRAKISDWATTNPDGIKTWVFNMINLPPRTKIYYRSYVSFGEPLAHIGYKYDKPDLSSQYSFTTIGDFMSMG